MKKLLPIFLVLAFISTGIGQVTNEGTPRSWDLNQDLQIETKVLPSFNLQTVKAEDALNDKAFDKPWRFGYMHSVDYGLGDGTWKTLDNGDRIWRIAISSPEALSLNFIFDDFYLPDGASVYLYSDDRKDLLGAYTSVQNQESGILGTWLVKGDTVWIEYFEPAVVAGQGRLHIAKATHGYRSAAAFSTDKALNDSGDCNLDVECSIGDDWAALKDHNKKSVGILLAGGSGFCSGALINNTANDGTPYFLTANHCFSDPAAWSFRFGWISPNTVCATTDNSESGPTNMTISGGTLRARNANSDFCLIEINSDIPEDWDRVYAGWDKSDNFTDFQVGIHHPSGDVMKVCRDDTPATKEVNAGAQTWEITGAGGGWELGVTEPGSSGSPLFDQNGNIIGQLFGGGAACSGTNDNNAFDYYGRMGVSWDGSSAATRLRDWLDPTGSDVDIQNSFPSFETYELDGSISVNIPELVCGNTVVSPTITMINLGVNDITEATIVWSLDDEDEQTIEFSGSLAQYESQVFTLDEIDFSLGEHSITSTLTSTNGSTDENAVNDTATEEINVEALEQLLTETVTLSLTTDDYAEETSWVFRNVDGTVVDSFGPYQQTADDNTTFTYEIEVQANECYEFEIFDAFGDGICCSFGEGSYSLTQDDSTIIIEGGDFDSSELTEMAIGEALSTNELFKNSFSIYPNPTSNILNINKGSFSNPVGYTIVNIAGQQLKKGSLISTNSELSIQDLSQGIYFITINDSERDTYFTTKIIKN